MGEALRELYAAASGAKRDSPSPDRAFLLIACGGAPLGRQFRKGAGYMCVSCGCGEVHDDHGDPRHLTLEDLEQAAEAANLTVDQVVQNIQASGRQGGSSSSSGSRA